MKKNEWLIAAAAGAGITAIAYALLSKDNIPKGAEAVQPFNKNRYMGKWYEVARMPSLIEKNLRGVTEDYSLNDDGTIKVITKGYNVDKGKIKEATGKIKFAGAEYVGMLKVSYLGPFYAAYNILDLDADYQYALVSSSGVDYLWVLSRQTTVPDHIRTQFLNKAAAIGFDIGKLEWV
ncbi:lipocalin family protein [Mucilaginibacter glaciei]|uniref:Lipocalin family protein n=1 Tax=Mucilaginibacter glaciei TaxID=2772109 RepID=A0A926NND1_9SPHI|nr:lipocalin family protein [Mucilaginibacter glaciei]MBD1395264.1 lipocalin family protein [Mucilaginibacter glaciei]